MSNQNRLKKGQKIITVKSIHAHVALQSIGTIEEVLEDGYAVDYPATLHVHNFGGGKFTKAAIVFMHFGDVQPYPPDEPSDENTGSA